MKDPNAFIDYSQAIHNVYGYLEDCNPRRKRRVLIVFDDIISDMESNKKLGPKVSDLFLRGRKRFFTILF